MRKENAGMAIACGAIIVLISSSAFSETFVFRRPLLGSIPSANAPEIPSDETGQPSGPPLEITGEDITGYAITAFTVTNGTEPYLFQITGSPPANKGLLAIRDDGYDCGQTYCYRNEAAGGGFGSPVLNASAVLQQQAVPVYPGIYHWGVHVTDDEGRTGAWQQTLAVPETPTVQVSKDNLTLDLSLDEIGFGREPYSFAVNSAESLISGTNMPPGWFPADANKKGLPSGIFFDTASGQFSGSSKYDLTSNSHTIIDTIDADGLIVRKTNIDWQD